MKKYVNVHEAKTSLSRLLARVAKGEHIVIAKNGHPVAELRPYTEQKAMRTLGGAERWVAMDDDFNAPLPADLLAQFEK